MALDLMNIVVRLNNIPVSYRTPEVTCLLDNRLGTVIGVIPPKQDYYQAFIRMLVQINIFEPFIPRTFLWIGDGSRKWIQFNYERLPVYCYLCGLVGHLESKCPVRFSENFIDPGKDFPYGECLKALVPGSSDTVGWTTPTILVQTYSTSGNEVRRTSLNIFQFTSHK